MGLGVSQKIILVNLKYTEDYFDFTDTLIWNDSQVDRGMISICTKKTPGPKQIF